MHLLSTEILSTEPISTPFMERSIPSTKIKGPAAVPGTLAPYIYGRIFKPRHPGSLHGNNTRHISGKSGTNIRYATRPLQYFAGGLSNCSQPRFLSFAAHNLPQPHRP